MARIIQMCLNKIDKGACSGRLPDFRDKPTVSAPEAGSCDLEILVSEHEIAIVIDPDRCRLVRDAAGREPPGTELAPAKHDCRPVIYAQHPHKTPAVVIVFKEPITVLIHLF